MWLKIILLFSVYTHTYGSNASICIEKGMFADIRGPYKHLLFNETLNGDIYYYPRPQSTHYLYPFVLNPNYYYFIGETIYSNQIHTYCLIGDIGVLGTTYVFDVNDCQYWASYHEGEWQHAADMIVTECLFEDICINDNTYLPYLNTDYKYMYWNYTVNGAYYYNETINKWVYPYIHEINNQSHAQYLIDSTINDQFAQSYCAIGNGIPWYYQFSFDHCQIFRSYYQLTWQMEKNMTITTNCIHNEQQIPTSTPTPTTIPTTYPTIFPSLIPSKTPTFVPSLFPTKNPIQSPSIFPSKMPTTYPTKTPTFVPSLFPTKNPIQSPTQIPSLFPTKNPIQSPTQIPTIFPTKNPIQSPTQIPTIFPTTTPTFTPSLFPSKTPTKYPTKAPILVPSIFPTKNPTVSPTHAPIKLPTSTPTKVPTKIPTSVPTKIPTKIPTSIPSTIPTKIPTSVPTINPSISPSKTPTIFPSKILTKTPTNYPSFSPTASSFTTYIPTILPSFVPTFVPTFNPTLVPTVIPTCNPTIDPSKYPTLNPTHPDAPSNIPTSIPITGHPSIKPSFSPSNLPSIQPTVHPSNNPSNAPIILTENPTINPTYSPISIPTYWPTKVLTKSPSNTPTIHSTNQTLPTIITSSDSLSTSTLAQTIKITSDKLGIDNTVPNNVLYIYILTGAVGLCVILSILMFIIICLICKKNRTLTAETSNLQMTRHQRFESDISSINYSTGVNNYTLVNHQLPVINDVMAQNNLVDDALRVPLPDNKESDPDEMYEVVEGENQTEDIYI